MTENPGILPVTGGAKSAMGALPEAGITPSDVDRLEIFWLGSRGLLPGAPLAEMAMTAIKDDEGLAVATETLARLRRTPSDQWVLARIAALLAHFYVSDLPPAVMEAIAGDWKAEMHGIPAWAILRATRWWLSSENKDRRKKPMPGDISERARAEMKLVTYLILACRSYERREDERFWRNRIPEAPRAEPSEESRARIDELVRSSFRQPPAAEEGPEAGADE
jgi:hypothetical protein